jgi:hypothetical protein
MAPSQHMSLKYQNNTIVHIRSKSNAIQSKKRNDPYTHFSQQPHNKLTWLVIFYYVFTKRKQNKTKKIIKYYQPDQLVVGLL